jgi:glycosyltransferase involved in cell wall biosynthesis
MKFSLITPSFNQGRFLPNCVESVLSQAGVEIERIVTEHNFMFGGLLSQII